MISLIALTMWRYPPFLDFLEYVIELPVIGEVILINNNARETPDHRVLKHPKLRMQSFEENIFVCPAWNLAVKMSKFDRICFLNDDVIVDLKIFLAANRFMDTNKEFGCLGIEPGVKPDQHKVTDGVLEIVEWKDVENAYGFAWIFFMLKENYIETPEEIKLFYSDTINLVGQSIRKKINYFVRNCFFYTPNDGVGCATTSKLVQSEKFPVYMVFPGVNNEDIAYKKWEEEFRKQHSELQ